MTILDFDMVDDLRLELAAAREHASISLARSASDGLAKEAAETEAAKLAGLLTRAIAFINYRSNLYNEIDAALAARAPQAAHSTHSDTVDAPPPEPPLHEATG